MNHARRAYAVRGEQTRLHVRRRYLPIIVVPGVMGSRLTDPLSDELVFNPLGWPLSDPGEFALNVDRLQQVSAELVPDATHLYEEEHQHQAVQHIRHFYEVLPSFYGPLAIRLANLKVEMEGVTVIPRVYCCGYDWRQDNAKSALRLAAVVEEALRETGEKQVLIFCHSMGGLVTRYYSRVLGGESKIFQVFLLASPSLGAAGGYAQLKNGLFGFPITETANNLLDGNVRDAVAEIAGAVPGAVAAFSEGAGGVATFLGDLRLIFSLGAGRMLTRAELTYILRQMPAPYQLLPNALLCKHHPHWILFDPLTTGYPPTGFMLKLPNLLDAAVELAAHTTEAITGLFDGLAEKKAEQVAEDIRKELATGDFGGLSGRRAERNVATLAEVVAAIGGSLADIDVKRVFSEDAVGELGKVVDAGSLAAELYERFERCFIDCRDPRVLYNDIYTGFLDSPQLRAIGAINVAQALAFQNALIVNARPEEPLSPGDLISKMLAAAGIYQSAPQLGAYLTRKILQSKEETKAIEDFARKLEAEKKRLEPKAYMHPRTFNVYCKDLPTPSTCVVAATDVVSLDDNNVVEGEFVSLNGPGDGTVMAESGNPSPRLLSHAFLDIMHIAKTAHTAVPNQSDVLKRLEKEVTVLAPAFFRDSK